MPQCELIGGYSTLTSDLLARLLARREIKVKVGYHNACKEVNFLVDPDEGNNVLTK
jgi:hypothetical protein